MLSRTADNLYWMGRYIERAETMARLIEVGARMNLMPDTVGGFRSEWAPILQASGTTASFEKKFGDPVERNVVTHLFFDQDNPSSVSGCLRRARENARIVRTALTSPVWDALNTAYQELKQLERTERSVLEISDLTEWTSRHYAQTLGAMSATLLRNDGWHFVNLGKNLECADNTARFMDVKYYVLLPDAGSVGSGLDNFQWQTLLRGMQMQRAFYWAYGDEITPARIVHLLILNEACPKSLRAAVQGAAENLEGLAAAYGGRTQVHDRIGGFLHGLKGVDVDAIFDEGLHEFLTRFKNDVASVGRAVSTDYLQGEPV